MKNDRNAALNGGRGSGQTVRRISEMYEAKIADLKANADFAIEGRDVEIKELKEKVAKLEKQNFTYYNEREYNNKEQSKLRAEIKTMLSEIGVAKGYIGRIEKEKELLGERCNQLLKDKGNLTDEIQELKETFAQTIENDEVAYETLKLHDQEEIGMLKSELAKKADTNHSLVEQMAEQNEQLEQAREHIRTLISCLIDWVQEGDKDYCYIADAEQFLKEETK